MSQAPKRKSEGALTTSGSASNLEQTYFELNSNSYLIVVDYYSKYPELCLLKDKTAGSVITSMKSMFARHGIPDEVVADNMPFSSKSFVSLQGIGVLLSVPRVLVPMEKWDE